MTKISKFLLFFFVSLCLACLIASQVHALDISYSVLRNVRPFNSNKTHNISIGNAQTNDGLFQSELNFDNNLSSLGNNYLKISYALLEAQDFDIDGGNLHNVTWNYIYQEFTPIIGIVDSTNTLTKCTYDNSDIVCPVSNDKTYTKLRFYYYNITALNGMSCKYVILATAYVVADSNTQQIINNNNQNATTINNNITDVNNSINSSDITGNNSSDSITGITSSFQSSNDWLLNIFTLPYTFITAIMNGVSDSCSPISLGTIFDYDLVMPCMNLNSILGNVWTTIVDVICAGVFAFAFRKRIHDFIFAIITLDRKAIKIGGVDIL